MCVHIDTIDMFIDNVFNMSNDKIEHLSQMLVKLTNNHEIKFTFVLKNNELNKLDKIKFTDIENINNVFQFGGYISKSNLIFTILTQNL